MQKAFTLIEIMVAISVMTIGVVGVYALVPRVISTTSMNIDRFLASQLAREGIELVRNIRDTNWLQAADLSKSSPWDDGLPSGEWEADYSTLTFANTADFEKCTDGGHNCDTCDGDFLKIENGFYNYASGTKTPFKRKITISPQGDGLNIKVQITWAGKGSPLGVEENLYDWR